MDAPLQYAMPPQQADTGRHKRKHKILDADEGQRQLQQKLDAERMSDEEFDALWRELRADAIVKERQRNRPLDEAALRAAKPRIVAAPVDDEPHVPATPENEYWITSDMEIEDTPGDLEVATQVDEVDVAQAEADASSAPAEPELTFEQAVDKLMGVVTGTTRFREIHRKTLTFCKQRRALPEVEEKIQSYPEYEHCAQNPYRLIRYLIDGGGLDLIELDAEGEVVDDDRKLGLTEDEVDDLIDSFALKTTPVGEQVADEMEPANRIQKLLDFMPVRFDSYVEVMEFLREPKSMKQINELFDGRDLHYLGTMHSDKNIAIQPSVFVDKLERAGAIVWDGAWRLTPEGEGFLAGLSKASA